MSNEVNDGVMAVLDPPAPAPTETPAAPPAQASEAAAPAADTGAPAEPETVTLNREDYETWLSAIDEAYKPMGLQGQPAAAVVPTPVENPKPGPPPMTFELPKLSFPVPDAETFEAAMTNPQKFSETLTAAMQEASQKTAEALLPYVTQQTQNLFAVMHDSMTQVQKLVDEFPVFEQKPGVLAKLIHDAQQANPGATRAAIANDVRNRARKIIKIYNQAVGGQQIDVQKPTAGAISAPSGTRPALPPTAPPQDPTALGLAAVRRAREARGLKRPS